MHLIMLVRRFALLACFAGLALAGQADAQTYPAKPVKIVVAFSPGGPPDVMGRIFADKLSAMWGQPVFVENRGGAGGNIGSEYVAKSVPDGTTLLLAPSSHVTNGALYSKLAYDPIRDFTPISQVAYYPLVLVVHPTVPATTLKELVALAKAEPGKLMLASAGSGTPTHLTAELFRSVAGIDFVHVPYKGAAPATNDLLGGQAQMMFNNPVSAMPHVKSGRLRALATTSAQRAPVAPDVPTVAESGYPGFEAGTWYAFLGPAGIAKEIQARLAADIVAVTQMADVRSRFAAMGVDPIGTTPEQLAAIMQSDLEKWTKVIRAANIKAD
jgi:tripartite-type tricarboxylate transporter receptor subunit TctC